MVQRKSVIHIGLHKTGSTTLQNCLGNATQELLGQGYLYPVGQLHSRTQHSELANQIRTEAHGDFSESIGRILDDLAQLDDGALILSGEAFSKLTREKVSLFYESLARAGRQFHIVLYVRNLYRYAASLIAQKSKTAGFIAYPDTVLRRLGPFDPSSIISTWEQVFGADRVHVFCLDALPDPRGVVAHFAEFSGFSLPSAMPAPELNRSIDPIASTLLTHLVHEFQLPQQLFYSSYFETAHERVALPRVEHYLNRLVTSWVREVDVTHPKLKPYRQILRKRPSSRGPVEHQDGWKYLEMLSVVLASISGELKRSIEEPNRRSNAKTRERPRRRRRKRTASPSTSRQ